MIAETARRVDPVPASAMTRSSRESSVALGSYGLLLVVVLRCERGGIVGGVPRRSAAGRRQWQLVRR